MAIHEDPESTSPRTLRRALLRAAGAQATLCWAALASGKAPGQTPAPPPVAAGAWQRDWRALIESARKEGRLSVLTWGNAWGGPGFRGFAAAVERFEQVFPGVAVDRVGESSARVWLGQIERARSSGRAPFDVALVQPSPAITEGRAKGLWSPLEPLLFHPDVTDEASWRDGTSARFLDAGGDLCFACVNASKSCSSAAHLTPAPLNHTPEPAIVTAPPTGAGPRWRSRLPRSPVHP